MKFNLIITFFIISSFTCYAQSSNNLSLVYGIASTAVASTGTYGVDPSVKYHYIVTSGSRYGGAYTHNFNRWVAIESELLYINDGLQLNTIYNNNTTMSNPHLAMLSGQVFLKFSFLKYFFADGGLGADLQVSPSPNSNTAMLYDQSGPCIEAGCGAKINFGKISFSANPFLRDRGIITIGKTTSNNEQAERGIKFAVGYDF